MQQDAISIRSFIEQDSRLKSNNIFGDGLILKFNDIDKIIVCGTYQIKFELKCKQTASIEIGNYITFIGKMKNDVLNITKYYTCESKERLDTIMGDIKYTEKKLEKMVQTDLYKKKTIGDLLSIAIINIGKNVLDIPDELINSMANISCQIDIENNVHNNLMKTFDVIYRYRTHSAICIFCEDDPNIVYDTYQIEFIKLLNSNCSNSAPFLIVKNKQYSSIFEKYTNLVFEDSKDMVCYLDKLLKITKDNFEKKRDILVKSIHRIINEHKYYYSHFVKLNDILHSKYNISIPEEQNITTKETIDLYPISQKLKKLLKEKRELYDNLITLII